MLCIPLGLSTQEQSMSPSTCYNTLEQVHQRTRYENQLLPLGFTPTDKDIICGRARENFHHDGNRYFRDLIQGSIGPYIAARTKIEKSDAIASIVDHVQTTSPSGGFVKRDAKTDRWHRIKESEARDKVGHAIRKVVQRLEDTKPKTLERLRKQYATNPRPACASPPDTQTKPKDNDLPDLANLPSANSGQPSESPSLRAELSADDDRSAGKVSPRFMQELHWRNQSQADANLLSSQRGPFGNVSVTSSLSKSDAVSRSQLLSSGSIGQSQFFQRNGLPMNSTQIVARRLLAQRPSASVPTSYDHLLGLRGANLNHSMKLEGFKAPEEVLLKAIQQQQEAKRMNELGYARRLALSEDQRLLSLLPGMAAAASTLATGPLYTSLQQLRKPTGTESGEK